MGDKLAVTLPSEVVEFLHLQEDSPVILQLTADRHHVLLTPGNASPLEVDPVYARQVADFIDQYRPALEALAKRSI